MKDIDSVLYLLGSILAVDGLTEREMDYIKQNIFQKLEKAHIHVELSPHKIAIYLKHTIPDMVTQIHDTYTAKTNRENFEIPETIRNNCIKHLKNLKNHISKDDLKNLINESIKIDGTISMQETKLRDFIFTEIDEIFG